MTASTERRRGGRTRAGGADRPTSSSSGTPRAARPRCTRCSRATRRSTCPTSRSRGSSRATCAPRFAAAEQRGCRETLEEYLALFDGRRAASSAWARPRRPTCGRAPPPSAIAAAAARRADHRDPARAGELPALAAPAAAADHVETEKDLRKAIALEAPAGRQTVPRRSHRPQLLRYSDHVRYVEQLRRYRRGVPARAGAGADLRRLPRRQRGDGAHGAALPRGGRRDRDRATGREPHASACARSGSTKW